MELGVLGPLQVLKDGAPVAIPGAKPRAILTMLGLHSGSVVSASALFELLWGTDQPRTADKALQTHISSLRRTLGDGVVLTAGAGWTLAAADVDAERYKLAAKAGRDAAAAGDTSQAAACFEEALTLWRGIPELPDSQRGVSEKTRWIESHAALVEDRADALLATGRAAEIIGELEAAVAEAPLRERRWGQLMLALYRAGRQGEALGAYRRVRSLLADELGVDPGPELRRLEAAIVAQDAALDTPGSQQVSSVTRAVTFLLTDIEGSTAAWEADAAAMALALARHDEIVEQVVTSRGGRLIKTRGEGDATFSVFERPSAAAAAAIELQDAITHEPWALREPMRIRVALHTGEVELRDGDYFGRAVNRVARLRSLAVGGQILCSGATAELVIDSLPDDVLLADLGIRQLRNLARPEHVFELRVETDDVLAQEKPSEPPIERPAMPAVLAGPGPFVGRGSELARLLTTWQNTLASGTRAVLIAGEPGVGKTRLAGEWSHQAYEQGAVVLYGRCDEDLGAPYQPFAEALRSLMPCVGASRLRALRGVEALLPLVPAMTEVLPDLTAPARADPDTERYALFDAVVALLEVASAGAPVVLVLDDLHWAAKPTLLLLRHLLRFGEHARVQIVGTYRSTDLDRSHPLAAMLADLHRDGTANRISLGGLDEDDVTAYVAEAGYDDEELARALASVTGGNPFFLIEALRHVEESGGVWDPSTLPQGVREAVSRRLSRLPAETNKALAAAAVVGSRFALELVERVVGEDLVDAVDEASKAGIVIEEPGGYYRFNHAIVRQSLLAELASVRRMRLHQRIAATLETQPGADDELLAELAYHYFECAWAGNASKAVLYCRRAADQAVARLAYEGAADLYDRALHALEEIDEELPDREDQIAELLVARCEALLAAGDVASAAGAVSQLQEAAGDSARLAAWATCFDGQLTMLVHPERLDEVEAALGAAADKLAELGDAAGEAKAHTERAACLGRLGRVADCEIALDNALTAARRAREHRRVNEVLAGAPLAALWGPNPVPRAGGRCLDVVRLLRITTDSPAVEATSTRCQAVLEAFRGRAAAAQRMIDSARRTVTELGLRHALLEVEQFAGIVDLVADDPAAAEPHLRQAYNGFRRMGLDADTAETAALLARACLALGRDDEADQFCLESERLAGHALKASIAWRTVRAQLLARRGEHLEARRVAEDAVALAERTDALVDHGDACMALATVLDAAGDVAAARAAAERAVDLYERKGAAALADKARGIIGKRVPPAAPAQPEAPVIELDNACVRVGERMKAAIERGSWDEVEQMYAPELFVESRRKLVGFAQSDLPIDKWAQLQRRAHEEAGGARATQEVIAVRGERLALCRLVLRTVDPSPDAPQYEFLQLYGIDEDGLINLQIWFDVDDVDAAISELDAIYARFEAPRREPDNACVRAVHRLDAAVEREAWDEMEQMYAHVGSLESRRKIVGFKRVNLRPDEFVSQTRRFIRDMDAARSRRVAVAVRGERLALIRSAVGTKDESPGAPQDEMIQLFGLDEQGRIKLQLWFDVDDMAAALTELDAIYAPFEAQTVALDNVCVRALRQFDAALQSGAWNEFEQALAPDFAVENRRKIVGFSRRPFEPNYVAAFARRLREEGAKLDRRVVIATRGDRHALTRVEVGTTGDRPGAPRDQLLHVVGLDDEGRIALQVWFDIEDIDAAMAELDAQYARLEHLPNRVRLENAATRVNDRIDALFAESRWDQIGELLADEFRVEDRRLGLRRVSSDRATEVTNLRAMADTGVVNITTIPLARRGNLLCLSRVRVHGRDTRPEAFHTEALSVVEVNSDETVVARITFDANDFEAALAELDSRYLAGEAADHAQTWSVITKSYAAINRHEPPPTTPDWINVDHRHETSMQPSDFVEYIRSGSDRNEDVTSYVETVHRLNDLGAVITYAAHELSHEGFEAEWRGIAILTVVGDMVNRTELFAETDLTAALARFDGLRRTKPRLENAASQAYKHLQTHYAAGAWDAIAETLADDIYMNDRRRVVGAGVRSGRDDAIADMRSTTNLGITNVMPTILATRGDRLVLVHARYVVLDQARDQYLTEVLNILETDADGRIAAGVVFDRGDIDAAFEELDTRYLAGEAAPYARVWQSAMEIAGEMNRHEPGPMMTGLAYIDH
ncbi:MAG: BTAD domain-containing putative transcriptional regulator, partial [Candidatus Sericytochromatia bacterium]